MITGHSTTARTFSIRQHSVQLIGWRGRAIATVTVCRAGLVHVERYAIAAPFSNGCKVAVDHVTSFHLAPHPGSIRVGIGGQHREIAIGVFRVCHHRSVGANAAWIWAKGQGQMHAKSRMVIMSQQLATG